MLYIKLLKIKINAYLILILLNESLRKIEL